LNCFSSINQFLVNWFRQWSSLRNQDKLIVYFCLYAALIKPTARTLFKNLIPKWPSKAMSFYLNIYFACFFFNLFNWCMHFACSSSFSTNYTWKLYIYFVTFMQITLNLLFVCIHNLHYNISICKVSDLPSKSSSGFKSSQEFTFDVRQKKMQTTLLNIVFPFPLLQLLSFLKGEEKEV